MSKLYSINNCENLTIGRSDPCDIVCENIANMSSHHLSISKNKDEFIAYMHGRNGGYIGGKFVRCKESIKLTYGQEVELYGLRFLWLETYIVIECELCKLKPHIIEVIETAEYATHIDHSIIDMDVERTNLCKPTTLYFSKSPRTFYSVKDEVIELDPPPEKHVENTKSSIMTIGPAFTMALPMLLGFTVTRFASKNGGTNTFMYTGIITAISSALLGATWAYSNIKNRNRELMIAEQKRQAAYKRYVNNSELLIRERYNLNVSMLRLMNPGINEYFADDYNKVLLWQRSEQDDDFLKVRLGVGNTPSDIDISIPKDRFSVVDDELKSLPQRLKSKYSILKDVPKTVDLRFDKCVGIISRNIILREERFFQFVMATAVIVSPLEVKIVCCINKGMITKEAIEGIRFIPHYVSGSTFFSNITSQNTHVSREDIYYIFITDDYERVVENIGDITKYSIVVVTDSFDKLPSNCTLIIQNEQQFSGYIKLSKNNSSRSQVYFDRVTADEVVKYSRVMQSIPVRCKEEQFALPDKLSYFELLGITINEAYIIDEWQANTTINEIKAPIGIAENGEILVLDLHEKKHGPHGLIAGMTGSGKSEILQTLILSLAVKYSPMDIGFFLIDYKGGGMAKLFEKLPHVLGSISNLSGKDIYRAMVSIRSENERRQIKFNKAFVNNIYEYHKLYKAGATKEAIPHIFIIIDEFAELKREEPEFMKELISVARVGRSLGVHLILATQKPTGVVDDNIFSNSRFRICLRLQDKSDSIEMLHKPDAADIRNPGRAYLQVGNDEVYVRFQGAYTMDKSLYTAKNKDIKFYETNGEEYVQKDEIKEEILTKPQLIQVVETICEAAKHKQYVRGRPLWLDPLPHILSYETFINKQSCGQHDNNTPNHYKHLIPIGIYDDPAHQKQEPLYINILDKGHHIILGTLQCGKSTLLSTISYALINNFNKNLINIYCVDFSGGKLAPFKESLLCGLYVGEENEEDVGKLMLFILEKIEERKSILRGGNFLQIKDNSLPAIVLMIDNFAAFRDKTSGQYDKDLEHILKTGMSYGIYVLAAANTISTADIPKRIFDCFCRCIPLKLKDKYEYKDALLIPSMDFAIPEDIRGRGLAKVGGAVCEFQAFLPVNAEDDFERTEILRKKIAELNAEIHSSYGTKEIKKIVSKVPRVPKKLTMKNFILELQNREQLSHCNGIPIGFFEQSGKTYFLPCENNKVVLISGRSKSGKSNLLQLIKAMYNICVDKEKNNASQGNYESVQDTYKSFDEDVDNLAESITFENGMRIFVYDEALPFAKLNEIKKQAGDNPYVIHLGGALDRQNVADFSYIPYSKQGAVLNAGKGIVRKTFDGYEYGEIVIPKFEEDSKRSN